MHTLSLHQHQDKKPKASSNWAAILQIQSEDSTEKAAQTQSSLKSGCLFLLCDPAYWHNIMLIGSRNRIT